MYLPELCSVWKFFLGEASILTLSLASGILLETGHNISWVPHITFGLKKNMIHAHIYKKFVDGHRESVPTGNRH